MDTILIIKISTLFGVVSAFSSVVFGLWSILRVRYARRVKKETVGIFNNIKKNIFKVVSDVSESVQESQVQEIKVVVTPQDNVEIQKILREVELAMGDQEYEEAERLLIEALSYNPNDEDVNGLLGFIYLKRKKYAKAENIFVHMIERGVKDPAVYGNLAKVLAAEEKLDLAILSAREAQILDSKTPARYVYLAELYVAQGMKSEAVEAYEDALRIGGRNIDIFKALSPLFLEMLRYTDAYKVNKEILEIEPYNEEAKLLLLDLDEKGYLASSK